MSVAELVKRGGADGTALARDAKWTVQLPDGNYAWLEPDGVRRCSPWPESWRGDSNP